jgi:hypothetical protein
MKPDSPAFISPAFHPIVAGTKCHFFQAKGNSDQSDSGNIANELYWDLH